MGTGRAPEAIRTSNYAVEFCILSGLRRLSTPRGKFDAAYYRHFYQDPATAVVTRAGSLVVSTRQVFALFIDIASAQGHMVSSHSI